MIFLGFQWVFSGFSVLFPSALCQALAMCFKQWYTTVSFGSSPLPKEARSLLEAFESRLGADMGPDYCPPCTKLIHFAWLIECKQGGVPIGTLCARKKKKKKKNCFQELSSQLFSFCFSRSISRKRPSIRRFLDLDGCRSQVFYCGRSRKAFKIFPTQLKVAWYSSPTEAGMVDQKPLKTTINTIKNHETLTSSKIF